MKYVFMAVLTSLWLIPAIAAFVTWCRNKTSNDVWSKKKRPSDAAIYALAYVTVVLLILGLIALTLVIAYHD